MEKIGAIGLCLTTSLTVGTLTEPWNEPEPYESQPNVRQICVQPPIEVILQHVESTQGDARQGAEIVVARTSANYAYGTFYRI